MQGVIMRPAFIILNTWKTKMKVTIDIETVPGQEPWIREKIEKSTKHPAKMTKQETIDKWEAEKKSEAVETNFEKCSFKGLHNNIITIGVAIDDEEPFAIYNKPEQQILDEFYTFLKEETPDYGRILIGHNIIGFDLKIIKQRSMILGITPAAGMEQAFLAKPWDRTPYDTMIQWDSDRQSMTSLDDIAQAMGIENTSDVKGNMVYGLWKAGNHDQIAEYCKKNLEMVE